MPKKSQTAITEAKIRDMVAARDFSPVEDRVPEFIAVVLNVSAPLMQQALKCALENEKIGREINKHIHETSKTVVADYTAIVKLEQQGISETNKRLGDALIQLGKVESPSSEQVTMYFQTLQAIQRNADRMTESRQQAEQFIVDVQEREEEAVARKTSPFLKAIWEFAQTPEGAKAVVEIGKALYTAFAKGK